MSNLEKNSSTTRLGGAIATIKRLEVENTQLRNEVNFLREHPTLAKGIQGESLIAQLISANISHRGASHDLVSIHSELLFEVKYSSLLHVNTGYSTRRWVWTKLFGELGYKQYHRLLLVGEADPRFSSFYTNPLSPYVFFDLPYNIAINMSGGIKPGRSSAIHLTTNPHTVKSKRSRILFQDYQVSASELQYRYGLR